MNLIEEKYLHIWSLQFLSMLLACSLWDSGPLLFSPPLFLQSKDNGRAAKKTSSSTYLIGTLHHVLSKKATKTRELVEGYNLCTSFIFYG